LLLAVAVCPFAAGGQAAADPRNVDATQFGERVSLGPDWLFAPGDNPAYAAPALNDSGWKAVSASNPLITYGYHDLPYAWYRLHIHLRPDARNLMIGLENVHGSYQIYANGVLVGGKGNIAGMARFYQPGLVAASVPDGLLGPRGDLVLAVRFALDTTGSRGRGTSTPIDSDSGVYLLSRDAAPREASYSAAHNAAVYLVLTFLSLLAGLVAVALFRALHSEFEYLAVALYLFASSGAALSVAWSNLRAETLSSTLFQCFCIGVANFALIEFVRLVLRQTNSRWLLTLELASLFAPLASPFGVSGIAGFYVGFAVYFLPILIVDILLPVMLVKSWREGDTEARVLLPAILLYGFAQYWNFLRFLVFYLHLTVKLHSMPTLSLGSYDVSLSAVGNFVFYLTMLLFLVLRTVGIARERERSAGELEAARSTQQLLLARASQPTPGFRVETVYYPASEVGGDFFYVATNPVGALMAVVGDVSGKGLIAAMRVAMILGVLRREDSWEPGQVLSNLNQALLTREEGCFTTACCVRLEKDGHYTFASAGHIPPFVDGRELLTLPSLPLGLVAHQHYAQSTGSLSVRQKLVLLSDGVVEARSTAGELLGFDRVAMLTLKSAHEIAGTARNFGQEDDITVLTLARTA